MRSRSSTLTVFVTYASHAMRARAPTRAHVITDKYVYPRVMSSNLALVLTDVVLCLFLPQSSAGRKKSRRNARATKAAKTFPRPVAGALRPVVQSQTQRYNFKKRLGRGFTLDELKVRRIARPLSRSQALTYARVFLYNHRRRVSPRRWPRPLVSALITDAVTVARNPWR